MLEERGALEKDGLGAGSLAEEADGKVCLSPRGSSLCREIPGST